jgi:hypothetical protein
MATLAPARASARHSTRTTSARSGSPVSKRAASPKQKPSTRREYSERDMLSIAFQIGYRLLNWREISLLKLIRMLSYHGRNIVVEVAIAERASNPHPFTLMPERCAELALLPEWAHGYRTWNLHRLSRDVLMASQDLARARFEMMALTRQELHLIQQYRETVKFGQEVVTSTAAVLAKTHQWRDGAGDENTRSMHPASDQRFFSLEGI